jgi:hypothetical protein
VRTLSHDITIRVCLANFLYFGAYRLCGYNSVVLQNMFFLNLSAGVGGVISVRGRGGRGLMAWYFSGRVTPNDYG